MKGSYIVWISLLGASAFALWQLGLPEPELPPRFLGILLLFIGTIAGLRWGADSASQLIKEMSQLNRYLAEQNQQLAELDHFLIKQIVPEKKESEESAGVDS